MIKLFYAVNTCSLASHIALEEAGATYTTERLSFASNEQRGPEYLAINPKGRVPAMVTDRGILTETPAMLAYIAQSFPQARLAPLDDPLRFCPGAGVQQLSLLDGACRPCAPHARSALGRRPGRHRRDAAQGAAICRRVL
jgi:glutathione S-transferase